MANFYSVCLVLLLVLNQSCFSQQNKPNYKLFQKQIVVDADPSDWEGIRKETIDSEGHLWIGQGMVKDNWQGVSDLSFSWQAAYSGNKLYFIFEVTDDTLCPDIQNNTWLNDCIELCFDPMNKQGLRKDSAGGKQIFLGYETHFLPTETPHAYLRDDVGDYVLSQPQDNLFKNKWGGEMATKKTPRGYIMEIAISIPELELKKGTVIGFETAICDNDGKSRINLLTWTGIQNDYWISLDRYGKLIVE